ncbi:MAG: putative subtilase-type serine protease precursor [Verrucomicrobiales bacterium]|nr:putative subtilase-type serine protease precursor [Verrucomicrobiales bacterium]
MKKITLSIVTGIILVVWNTLADPPVISRMTPLAVSTDKATELTVLGSELDLAATLWTSFEAKVERRATSRERATFVIQPDSKMKAGLGAIRVIGTNGVSKLAWVMIDDIPNLPASSTNGSPADAQLLKLPCAIDGHCEEKAPRYFKFSASKGQPITFDIVAQRIGSALDPVVRLLAANQRELAYCEDTPGAGSDSRFTYTFKAGGEYWLELRDTRYGGGSDYQYRLRVGDLQSETLPLPFLARPGLQKTEDALPVTVEVEPNDKAAQHVAVPTEIRGRFAKPRDRDLYQFEAKKGDRLIFQSRTRSLGSPCDLYLKLQGADGKTIAESNLSGSDETSLTNTFKQSGACQLLVEEATQQGGPEFFYQLEIDRFQAGFELSLDTDTFNVSPGGTFELKLLPNRQAGYDGPIRIALEGAGQGFTLSTNVITSTTNATTIKVSVPESAVPAQLMLFKIRGTAEGREFSTIARTHPALRKQYPLQLWPPRELDGWVALGIRKPAEK